MFGINKIIPVDSKYEFMRLRKIMLYISSSVILISILLLMFKGLNLGIDFKGGTLIEVTTKNTNISELRKILSSEFNDVSLQEFGNSGSQDSGLRECGNSKIQESWSSRIQEIKNSVIQEFRKLKNQEPRIHEFKNSRLQEFRISAIV